MSYKFEPTKQTLNSLFGYPTSKYIIPKYQREYSWKKQQLEEFWKLILSDEEIFIGTVIFYIEDSNKNKEIIDGQQRYLTTIIAASALRDVFFEKFKKTKDSQIEIFANDIQEGYIGKREPGTNHYQNYLEPGLTTKTYFNSEIQTLNKSFLSDSSLEIIKSKSQNNSTEENLIIDGYNYFKDQWRLFLKSNTDKYTFDYFRLRLDKCFVIRIEIDSYELAFDIFESVNDQGIRLGVSDLLKNQILKNIDSKPASQQSAVEKWNEMINFISEVKMTPQEFLRYYWASKYGYVSDKQLYKKIKREIKQSMSNDWDAFLDIILDESEMINNIYNYNLDSWIKFLDKKKIECEKFENSIETLKKIKVKTWLIIIISIIRNNKKLSSHNVDFVKHIDKIKKFTVLYFSLMGNPGNWYFDLIWRTSVEIENATTKKEFTDIFLNLFKEFSSKLSISEDQFKEALSAVKYKPDMESKAIINLFFTEIEMKRKGTKFPWFNSNYLNIEHILPQEPKNWNMKPRDVKNHINNLGNLVIIPYSLNGRLGNLSCSDKMKILKAEGMDFKIVEDIVLNYESGSWPFDEISKINFAAIEKRQEDLAKLGYEIWIKDFKKLLG